MHAGDWIALGTMLTGLIAALGTATVAIIHALRDNTIATNASTGATVAHTAAIASQQDAAK